MSQFPVWKHHKEHKDKLVQNKEELQALGEGWGDDSHVWRPELLEEFEEKSEEIASEVSGEQAPEVKKQKKGKKNAS